MSKARTVSNLAPVQREHYEVAKSFDGGFSTREFAKRYRALYPDRNSGSFLPSDFSWNNTQKGWDEFPHFLGTVAYAKYIFVGLDCDGPLVRKFLDRTSGMPRTTDSDRLAVQRIGKEIFSEGLMK